MKRFLILIIALFSIISFSIANDSFDVTQNYQNNNAMAYEGEILHVAPLPKDDSAPWYFYFMEPSLFDDDYTSENSYVALYHPFGSKFGSDPAYLAGKNFRVDKVKPLRDYTYTWIFYLTNTSDYSDKVKFIYHGDKDFHKGSFKNFPFYVEKYARHLVNELYNKNVYVSTIKQKWANWDCNYAYEARCTKDINGNPISYSKSYAKYKVIDINVDEQTSEIVLTLTNGKVTTTELYSLHYEPTGGTYNTCAKVFTESEWNSMVNKYGEEHMSAIMAGNIIKGMTYKECILSHGQPRRHNTKNADYNEYAWIFGNNYKTFRFDKSGNMISETTKSDDNVSITKAVKNLFNAIF